MILLPNERKLPDLKTFCFDLQQLQCLPKTPVNDAFYLRPISYYSLCWLKHNIGNPNVLTWTDDEVLLGTIEVVSAIYGFLKETFEKVEHIETK